MPHLETVPEEWADQLLSEFNKTFDPHMPHSSRYGDDLNGYVAFYPMSDVMNENLKNFFRSRNRFLDGLDFYYQVLTGVTRVAPHIDPPKQRTQGYLYLLDRGGENVITKFWKLKNEYANELQPEGKPIPDYKLDFVEEHHLGLREWWYGDYSLIHSVENLERPRITIIPYLATVEC